MDKLERFNAAVQWVKYFRIMPELSMTARAVLVARYRQFERNDTDRARRLMREFVEQLRQDAVSDKNAWNALAEIDPELLPGKRPRKGPNDMAKHEAIISAVFEVSVIYRLTPTRNPGRGERCCAEGGSACDAVGLAVDGSTQYKTVETIWTDRPPWIPDPVTFLP